MEIFLPSSTGWCCYKLIRLLFNISYRLRCEKAESTRRKLWKSSAEIELRSITSNLLESIDRCLDEPIRRKTNYSSRRKSKEEIVGGADEMFSFCLFVGIDFSCIVWVWKLIWHWTLRWFGNVYIGWFRLRNSWKPFVQYMKSQN